MWLKDLYDTYEANLAQVGVPAKNQYGKDFILLPIAHMYQNMQVEVALSENGEFISAVVLAKEAAPTVIPCTIESAARSNSPAPHGLHDNLQYVAKDFEKYGGKPKVKKIGKISKTSTEMYFEQLNDWCQSEFSHPRVKIIRDYLEKGTVIRDLLAAKVLVANHEGKLLPKWQKGYELENGEKPALFKVLAGDQFSTFVRFTVYDHSENPVWDDESVRAAFIQYFTSRIKEQGLCYVTGKTLPLADKHGSKIRYGGDMAKLISANDETGFTYRGRFADKSQAMTVSYDVSQKGHNALKWLISKQGTVENGRVFLIWGNRQTETWDFMQDSFLVDDEAEDDEDDMGQMDDNYEPEQETTSYTAFNEAYHLKRALKSYAYETTQNKQVNLLVMDAATPGRMSILYYRNFDNDEYLERIAKWHKSCSWQHMRKIGETRKKFTGAPNLKSIAKAAYGNKLSDSLLNATLMRLFPCVVDGKKLPSDLLESVINRASRPLGEEKWEWEANLSIACSLVNRACYDGYYDSPMFSVQLDRKNANRSYLFGRLLASAHFIEEKTDVNLGSTNAQRYMDRFRMHPASTWVILQEKLLPYLGKFADTTSRYYLSLIDQIGQTFRTEDFSDKKLDGRFLLGYYSQRSALYEKWQPALEFAESTEGSLSDLRSYRFGELLATAEFIERKVLYQKNENLDPKRKYILTNAQRLIETFEKKPLVTWEVLQGKLLPYETTLRKNRHADAETGRKYNYLKFLVAITAGSLPLSDFNNQRLTFDFLLGYYRRDYQLKKGQVNHELYKNQLDLTESDPAYLLGRYLGYLDVIEEYVLDDEPRETNTLRYLNTFSIHASRALENVLRLYPYYEKKAERSYSRYIQKVVAEKKEFEATHYQDFYNLTQASPVYLLGYYHQYSALKIQKNEKEV